MNNTATMDSKKLESGFGADVAEDLGTPEQRHNESRAANLVRMMRNEPDWLFRVSRQCMLELAAQGRREDVEKLAEAAAEELGLMRKRRRTR